MLDHIKTKTDWSKVSLYPLPSVAPVVIPALVPTLDKSLKADRSLCSVRALFY